VTIRMFGRRDNSRGSLPGFLKRFFRSSALIGLVLPIGFFLVWEYASISSLIDPRYFPGPSMIFSRGVDMFLEGIIASAISSTAFVMLSGLLVGGSIGYITGILTGISRSVRLFLEPFLSGLYTIPKIALLPIFLAIFGLGVETKIATVSASVFFYVWIYTMVAVIQLPGVYSEVSQVFRVNALTQIGHMVIPGSLRSALAGVRVAVAVSLLVTISAEFIVGGEGIGYLIFHSRAIFRLEDSYVGILLAAFLGLGSQILVKFLGSLLIRPRESSKFAIRSQLA
jgi:sulfonate transport system permease protein